MHLLILLFAMLYSFIIFCYWYIKIYIVGLGAVWVSDLTMLFLLLTLNEQYASSHIKTSLTSLMTV